MKVSNINKFASVIGEVWFAVVPAFGLIDTYSIHYSLLKIRKARTKDVFTLKRRARVVN